MKKVMRTVLTKIGEGSNYKKFTTPTVNRGKTAFPTSPNEQRRLGVRFDFDKVIKKDGIDYNQFQMQPNAGDDVPSAVKEWRNANGGTHAVMADVFVKKDGTKEDAVEGVEKATKEFTNE